MQEAKRQRIEEEPSLDAMLDKFEKNWSAYKQAKGLLKQFYSIFLTGEMRNTREKMIPKEPIDSCLLRSRLWRWWEIANGNFFMTPPPPLFDMYNMLSPTRRAKFFKVRLLRGGVTPFDCLMNTNELKMLSLLQPTDNLAFFYRYYRPYNYTFEQIQATGIFTRIPHLRDVAYNPQNYSNKEGQENAKFSDYPIFSHKPYVWMHLAFREWLVCYLMLGLDCDTPILEAVCFHLY